MNATSSPVVLITGGARRVGAALARAYHGRGYTVAIHCNQSTDAANALADELSHAGAPACKVFQADLCNLQEVQQLASDVLNTLGRCDLLINNASTFYPTPVTEANAEQWDDLFGSNARAPFFLSQALAASLSERYGSIINIADIHAYRPLAGHTLYCMAKAANIALTESLALELAPRVRVNGIAPGAILWPEDSEGNEVPNADRLSKIPLKTIGGSDAIVQAALFLSESGSYVSGEIIKVDGAASLT